MRIRKRPVPLPLSSLSPVPVPLSDPQFSRSPVVQLSLHNSPHGNLSQEGHTTGSDQPNQPIGEGTNGCDWSDASVAQEEKKNKEKDCLVLLQEQEKVKGDDERERSNDTRKKIILGASMDTGILPQSSSSLQAVGRWCEREKAFPLKKRRGSFERRANEETLMEEDKKMKSKMKTKMNKKCVQQNGSEQEEKETKESTVDSPSAKKKARGGALMEGSRCSRVNGRGWRCCQQTLVGYSLCEHHLGKGRLRSMTSVRNRSLANTAPKKGHSEPLSSSSSLQEKQPKGAFVDHNGENGNEEEDEKPLMITNKRMKLGMVKARSISSLLGQTDSAVAVLDNNK